MLKPSSPRPIARLGILVTDGQNFTNNTRPVLAISPDGTQIVYEANRRLHLRWLSEPDARPIPGTEVTSGSITNPAFSPDGRSIVFVVSAERAIKKIAIGGGAAVTVCPLDVATLPYGVTWDASRSC
jgi:Tol biopolymer transport system component